ncbi:MULTISPECIES: TonB-dependent siderophore receptor [unclassified Janthinobacterium]|uniref:TonB-dependent receptor n=1 Tax=unclassified Janthinobacterium TaxID=2610881 RepID=UPI000884E270|nr:MULTISPECIES: TonB-dependent siderophore receptor [unclassified Janthinobacterium]SDA39626.1 catecholate siderophore receptor [Janthinobacterium sp. 551a]SFA81533.1 catecholate siderophore receptor [Janthinobacterium sp. 344]
MPQRRTPGWTPITLAVFGALTSGAMPLAAWAQESLPAVTVTAAKDGNGYVAGTSASGTRTEMALRDVPQTINVVPAAVIRDQHAMSLQDIMKNIPGVGLSTGDGQRDQVFIRGFTAIGDQFVDGFRDDALYFRDLSNVERLDVIKGPAAVLYGRGSSGGLVNRITKKPGIDITDVALSLTNTKGRRGEVDVGRVGETVDWRFTGARELSDSYRDQQFINRTALAPSVAIRLSGATTLLLQGDYLEDRRLTDFGIPSYQGRPVAVDARTYYGAANARDADFSQSRVVSTAATLTHKFSDSLSLRNAFRYYDYHLDRNNTNISGNVNEVRGTMNLAHAKLNRDESGWFNQTELTQKLRAGATRHEVLYGAEFGKQNKDAASWAAAVVATNVSIFNPVLPVVDPGKLGVRSDTFATYDTAAAYVQDAVSFSDEWKALAGLRYDRYQQQSRLANGAGVTTANLSRTDSAVSPRAGLVWQPGGTQSYYASWSRSFQPSGENFALAANNANLAPETTRNTEVGAKYELWGGRANASVSLFRLERDNIKTSDPITNRIVPVGTQRTDGLELTFNADLHDGWKMMAGYAWLDATITDSIAVDRSVNAPGTTTASAVAVKGKRATLTSRNTANLWLTKDLGHGFTVGGGANAVGSRYANPGNTVVLPGYVTADAMAAYRTGRYEVQLNVNNIGDTRYIVSGHGSSPNLSLPGAPRNVALTLRYSL